MNLVGAVAEQEVDDQDHKGEGDEGQQIGDAARLEGVDAEAGAVLDDVARTVAGAQTQQDENAAGDRQEGVDAVELQHEVVMEIVLSTGHMVRSIVSPRRPAADKDVVRIERIELSSRPWEGRIIATIRYPRAKKWSHLAGSNC
jgi:hypothetical protein